MFSEFLLSCSAVVFLLSRRFLAQPSFGLQPSFSAVVFSRQSGTPVPPESSPLRVGPKIVRGLYRSLLYLENSKNQTQIRNMNNMMPVSSHTQYKNSHDSSPLKLHEIHFLQFDFLTSPLQWPEI